MGLNCKCTRRTILGNLLPVFYQRIWTELLRFYDPYKGKKWAVPWSCGIDKRFFEKQRFGKQARGIMYWKCIKFAKTLEHHIFSSSIPEHVEVRYKTSSRIWLHILNIRCPRYQLQDAATIGRRIFLEHPTTTNPKINAAIPSSSSSSSSLKLSAIP